MDKGYLCALRTILSRRFIGRINFCLNKQKFYCVYDGRARFRGLGLLVKLK